MPYFEVDDHLKMKKIAEKPGGVTRGFIGISVKQDEEHTLFTDFRKFYLKESTIDINDLDITDYDKLIKLFDADASAIKAKITIKTTSATEVAYKAVKLKFVEYCKTERKAYLVKNDHKDPRLSWGLFNKVSNPKENFEKSKRYQELNRTSTLAADAVAFGYSLVKRDSKENKNLETFDEVFALKLARIVGFQAPDATILVKKYKNGETKFCVKTRWESNLLHGQQVSHVDAPGRFLPLMKAFADYDILGSSGQNSALIAGMGHSGTDLYVYDCGHFLSSKTITNIAQFEKKNDEHVLIGLVNLCSALPEPWLEGLLSVQQIEQLEQTRKYIISKAELSRYLLKEKRVEEYYQLIREFRDGVNSESLGLNSEEKSLYSKHIGVVATKLKESFRNTVRSIFEENIVLIEGIQELVLQENFERLTRQVNVQLSAILSKVTELGIGGLGVDGAYYNASAGFNTLCGFLKDKEFKCAQGTIAQLARDIPYISEVLEKLTETLNDPDISHVNLYDTVCRYCDLALRREMIFKKLLDIVTAPKIFDIDSIYDEFAECISEYSIFKARFSDDDRVLSLKGLFKIELKNIKARYAENLNKENFRTLLYFIDNDFQGLHFECSEKLYVEEAESIVLMSPIAVDISNPFSPFMQRRHSTGEMDRPSQDYSQSLL
ncbi:hypothetical protein AVI51_07020 [Piscirickettsia salmonis]|uniref:Uncharacterized protein n=1 Tax=Piscirickettsia salmonis TaxID=1238 RepID=A0A9Q5VE94_PISSA|nr:hypothetical protein [Piscirickettsia salmonis]RNC77541.1 hypothetical protein DA717_09725 [Piscirickettsiaceae bacterium NZ-RLO2]ALA25824.1 alpha-L-Rha alpha-1,3-L-rhamnosyltransferase [Piscirickettsia salmonis]APS43302.1 hypothetical protein AVI48_02215 [Piscirickettsia salmonis]APS46652.1 hypothetical protein AVI49_02820 [Piscirickettsia salmonis]APS50630.1 hypothetical protein AVI50_07105 [Piscirickettsia salmonis]